jgi:hypothetical protein
VGKVIKAHHFLIVGNLVKKVSFPSNENKFEVGKILQMARLVGFRADASDGFACFLFRFSDYGSGG